MIYKTTNGNDFKYITIILETLYLVICLNPLYGIPMCSITVIAFDLLNVWQNFHIIVLLNQRNHNTS